MEDNPLLVVLGPTASGKTRLGVSLARSLATEIISADSRQVFKDMDIGTGKDLQEYGQGENAVPYHLIDILEAGDSYNVNAFKEDFYTIYGNLRKHNMIPLLCGGTGMYIHTILQDQPYTAIPVNADLRASLPQQDHIQLRDILLTYPAAFTAHADLSSAKRIVRAIEVADYLRANDLDLIKRPVLNPLVIGLVPDIELRRSRIKERLELRLRSGLIEEVDTLLKKGISPEKLTFYGLEYKFVTAYLQNEMTRADLEEKLYFAIRQFAKRQMTFFRKMEKDGVIINWIDAGQSPEQIHGQALTMVEDKWHL